MLHERYRTAASAPAVLVLRSPFLTESQLKSHGIETRQAKGRGAMEQGWTSSTRTVNGVSLHVAEAGPPDGPVVILLHGFPEPWWSWRHMITPLAEHGYHVVVPDMRGYNTSDAPQDVEPYRLEILSQDILALADSYGAERFRLVGHDWGGVIAWDIGASHPARLERLVVMNAPNADLWLRVIGRHPAQAVRSAYAAFFQIPRLPELVLRAGRFWLLRAIMRRSAREGAFSDADLAGYVDVWAHHSSLTAMLNYYRALRKRVLPREPRRIRTPTLILWGEKDAFLELSVARAALDLCDDGELSVIAGTTHWLHHEEPERVNAWLIAFLGDGSHS